VNQEKKQVLTEVWGDTVALRELLISAILGVVLTMSFFLAGRSVLLGMGTIETSLAKGYSLLVGIGGCLLSAVISARLFKPKRIIENGLTRRTSNGAGCRRMTVEEEAEALSHLDPKIIAEMEDLELYSLLALIPESSPNYKPEYRQYARSGVQTKED
jgi:hypothetical protein